MSTFCSDAGSLLISFFFWIIFFFLFPLHISTNENMSLFIKPECCEEEVTPPTKGYVIDLQSNCTLILWRVPPAEHPHRSHLILPAMQNAWPSGHFITLFIFSNRGCVHHAYINESMICPCIQIPSNNYSWPKAIASIKFSANVFWK